MELFCRRKSILISLFLQGCYGNTVSVKPPSARSYFFYWLRELTWIWEIKGVPLQHVRQACYFIQLQGLVVPSKSNSWEDLEIKKHLIEGLKTFWVLYVISKNIKLVKKLSPYLRFLSSLTDIKTIFMLMRKMIQQNYLFRMALQIWIGNQLINCLFYIINCFFDMVVHGYSIHKRHMCVLWTYIMYVFDGS